MKIVPIVLCGGSGTRLWPASRESYPKQFLSFESELSLFQATLRRVTDLTLCGGLFERPIVMTGADYRFLAAEQLRSLGVGADIVLEPCRRDSAAAVAAAALLVRQRGPDCLALVLAADHAVPDPAAFIDHVKASAGAAADGWVVTFGIRPTRPATGYGYIKTGEAVAGGSPVRAVRAFVEKPDAATAERYVAEGYLWNSGNFLFAPAAFLAEMERLAPEIADPVTEAVSTATRDLDFLRLDSQSFAAARATSVDYAVLEKTDRAAVLPSSFVWSDVGSWGSVHELAPKDACGNVAIGDAVFENAHNSIVHSRHGLTAVVGLNDVMVIATRDAVLVAPIDATADVKTLVERLKRSGRREATEHTKCFRPWGSYESLDVGTRHQVKRITVVPGGKLSLQSHVHRSEHWVVVAGTARVTIDDDVRLLTENESVYIPLGAVHRLENPGKVPLDLIEVQSGSYLGEDDIVRYEDVYNRQ